MGHDVFAVGTIHAIGRKIGVEGTAKMVGGSILGSARNNSDDDLG